ncbi:MAG: protein translocase subunit SecF [Deltaproteobacteria bacterium]|nr:protein translocase subunit SecF [Deltaproteobacteria bacterium]
MEFIRPDINLDFVGWRRRAITVSLVLILLGVASLVMKGGPRFGIDFVGGTLAQIKFKQMPDIGKIRGALAEKGMGLAIIQSLGADKVAIRVKSTAGEEENVSNTIGGILAKKFGKDNVSVELVEMVGPQVGADMRRKGMLSILYAMAGILVYITIRFQFRFALGAIIALIHDVMITIGVFSVMDKEFTLPVIAALLTIIGYSLNDTIVVYDRIRENMRKSPKDELSGVINASINQTLSRTILTSGTTFLVLICLFFLGGEVIHDFSFALLIGVVVGTYSSIFIASPILLLGQGAKVAPAGKRK